MLFYEPGSSDVTANRMVTVPAFLELSERER